VAVDWQAPSELPDLRRAGIIALDAETNDGGLLADRGSGWPVGDGYICGLSVAYREGGKIRAHYFPLRHPDSQNFDAAQLFQWLQDLIASDVRIITQNGIYDFGWLRTEAGILMPPSNRLEEIGALATIVDENRYAYSLAALCAWRSLPGKDETLLREAVKACGYKVNKKKPLQSHIWRMPARFVGPYAEADPANTLALWESLNPVLDQEGTRDAYRLEVDLLPMVLEMRRRGTRIDTTAAEQAHDQLLQKRDAVFAELTEKLGEHIGMEEIGRTKWLAETFDKHSIAYPTTKKGNPSFTAGTTGWMHKHSHWLPQLIVKADKYNNAAVNFLGNYILGHTVKGRVHAEIHPHRSDEGGTRSLRFSYSHPPLQLMTAHDEELAPLIRGVFLPEKGEVWAKPDVSQQEFRFIVHYAIKHGLRKAKEAAERYRTDPNTDFHQLVSDWTGLERSSAKNTNFAKAFGAGVRKFAAMIGKTESEARAIYGRYDRELPFVKQLAARCQNTAAKQGYLELYDGARRHWDSWEAPGVAWTKGMGPCSREEAERRIADPNHPWYRRWLRRAETHKAMNALIQGSAARHTKLWMRACWREGIVPLLQMHDALDCSVASPELAERVAQLGREAVALEVPMKVDLKFGRNWGDAKHSWEELTGSSPSHAQPTPPGINGAKVHTAAVQASIELPQKPETVETPLLADLIGERLVNGKMCCPFHDDATPSLHVYADHWHCFGCGAHGSSIDWLMMVEGLNYAEAVDVINHWSGPHTQAQQPDSDTRTLTNALRLWEGAQPIAGTLATRYLTNRRIDIDALPPNTENVLRFHPRCPFGPGTQHPCLLALFRDVETDAPAGIHRIALTPDAQKIERRMFGRWPTARAIKLWPAERALVIGEGIETTLAAATRIMHRCTPLCPAWPIGTSGGIARLPVIAGIERLTILVDNDANGVGRTNAKTCAERWTASGRTVVLLTPRQSATDFNDLVPSTCYEANPQ
jgi:DNA polymerase I-like protein with 3'-5' exonuclease and polymerase domains